MTRPAPLVACLLAIAALVAPTTVNAQPRDKVYRVGYIQTATPEEQAHLTRAFEEGVTQADVVRSCHGR